MAINKSTNIFLQIIAIAAQAYNQFGGLLPAKWQGIATLGLSIGQLIVGYIAHQSTPAGAPILTDPTTGKELVGTK